MMCGPGDERDGTVYGEPVDVHARADGRPLRFVWRSRLYTVRVILEHWVINREWWREPADPGYPAAPEGSSAPADPDAPEGSSAPADPDAPEKHSTPGTGPSAAAQPELEFWRVEASPGTGMPPGVYELRCEPATGTWTLRQS